jgi:uncharacterized protein
MRSTGPTLSGAEGTAGAVPLATTPEKSVPGAIPKLGVGLAYQPQLEQFINSDRDAFAFVEVVPDVLWNDMGPASDPRYIADARGTAFLRTVADLMPVIPHSIGLSIGSAHRFDVEHVEQMARWYDWLHFPWHSDHLAFHLAEHRGELNVNLTLPVVLDRESLAMIIERVREVQRRIPVPFLLENNVYYFDIVDQDFDEADFLNELCSATGCGIVLDLHNIHVNSVNRGTDPYAFLQRIDLTRVFELHVAGGMEFEGFYLDAHSATSPEPVWDLLDWVLPRCPHVGGVVFELFGTWFEKVGEDGLRYQLQRMRSLWVKHQATSAGCLT